MSIPRSSLLSSAPHLLVAASLLWVSGCNPIEEAACETDADCAEAFGLGSTCQEDGFCSTVDEDLMVNGVSASQVRTVGLSDLSGPLQDLGFGMRDGVLAAMSAYNEAHPYERQFVHEMRDDQYNPELSAEIVDELTADAGDGTGRYAFAILGSGGSPTSAAMLPILNERQVPLFGTLSGADHLRLDPPDRIVFNTRASYHEEGKTITQHLLSRDPYPIPPENVFAFSQSPSDSETDGLADAAEDAIGTDQTALDAFGYSGYLGIVDALVPVLGTQTDIPLGTYRGRTTNTDIAETFFFEWLCGLRDRLPGPVVDDGSLRVGVSMITVASAATPFIMDVVDGMNKLHAGEKPDSLTTEQWDQVDPQRKTELLTAEVVFATISPVGDQLGKNLAAAGPSTYCTSEYPVLASQVVPFPTGSSAGAIDFQRDLEAYDQSLTPGFVNFEGWIAGKVWIAAVSQTEGELTVDNLIDTLIDPTFSVDLGIGDPIHFSSSDHDGNDMVFGTTLATDCSYKEFHFAD